MADILVRRKNITKKDIMVALPEGIGITVKPDEYVAGNYFRALPASQFSTIDLAGSSGLTCAYTYHSVPVTEGYPIKYVSNIALLEDSTSENIFHGQIYANSDAADSDIWGMPNAISIPYSVEGQVFIFALATDLIEDLNYTGAGHKFVLTRAGALTCPIVDLTTARLLGLPLVPGDQIDHSADILDYGQYPGADGAQYVVLASDTYPDELVSLLVRAASKEVGFVEYTAGTVSRFRNASLRVPDRTFGPR